MLAAELAYRAFGGTAQPITLALEEITQSGNVTGAAIAPDGRSIAYITGMGGRSRLWLRNLDGNSPEIAADTEEAEFQNPIFSPDGGSLYYGVRRAGTPPRIYRRDLGAARAESILSDAEGPISLSPDQRSLVFMRRTRWFTDILQSDPDGRNITRLFTKARPDRVIDCALSNGKHLACWVELAAAGRHLQLIAIDTAGQREDVLLRRWPVGPVAPSVVWSGDGSLLIAANDESRDHSQVFRVSYPGGAVSRVTNDLSDYAALSIDRAGHRLVALKRQVSSHLWAGSVDGPGLRQVSSGAGRYQAPVFRADGKLLAHSNVLSILDPDSVPDPARQPALPDAQEIVPSPNGEFYVSLAPTDPKASLWRIDAASGATKPLIEDCTATGPSISSDSRWVAYSAMAGNDLALFRVPASGGKQERISRVFGLTAPVYSPDGRWIAAWQEPETSSRPRILFLLHAATGEVARQFPLPEAANQRVAWTMGSQAIVFAQHGPDGDNLWKLSLDSGQPVRLTDFEQDRIFSFSVSPGGNQVALARGNVFADAVLFRSEW
ncbi:MAG: hypothetical protein ABI782_12985 [Anaerolineaceae bacterium]